MSSTWRELTAVVFALDLESFLPLLKGSYIKWFSDGQNACRIIQVGSMRKYLHIIAPKIFVATASYWRRSHYAVALSEWVSVTMEYEWALPTLTRLLPDIARMCSASDVSGFTIFNAWRRRCFNFTACHARRLMHRRLISDLLYSRAKDADVYPER